MRLLSNAVSDEPSRANCPSRHTPTFIWYAQSMILTTVTLSDATITTSGGRAGLVRGEVKSMSEGGMFFASAAVGVRPPASITHIKLFENACHRVIGSPIVRAV